MMSKIMALIRVFLIMLVLIGLILVGTAYVYILQDNNQWGGYEGVKYAAITTPVLAIVFTLAIAVFSEKLTSGKK